MTETQFQGRITDLCDWLGLRWHHETDSRKSKKGFPDLVICGNRLVFAELKSEKGKVTAAQQEWLDDLATARVEHYVWRPSDWPQVEGILLGLAGR